MRSERNVQAETPGVVRITCGPLRCEIVPAIGGAVSGFWAGDTPVLRSVPGETLPSARKGGCFALLPYSNRVGAGKLRWRGEEFQLAVHGGDAPHAIHGVGWQRVWTVVQQDSASAVLSYIHRPDADWPFSFAASQTLRVTEDQLQLRLSYCNTHHSPVPVGLGWHPYFVKRRGAQLHFRTTGRWESGADKLPSERLPNAGFAGDCGALEVDHCYDGWDGSATLCDEALEVSVSANAGHLVVYTQAALDFVAVEPVSHVNNAMQLATQAGLRWQNLGLCELAAGETQHFCAEIRVRKR